MEDLFARIASDLVDRVSGPMNLRLLLQPTMATIFAVLAGLEDARLGNPPYFWALASNPGHRADLLRDGWKGVGKVFVLAILLDVIYQYIVQRFVYPGEAIVVAVILAIVPYVVFRGAVNRLTSRR